MIESETQLRAKVLNLVDRASTNGRVSASTVVDSIFDAFREASFTTLDDLGVMTKDPSKMTTEDYYSADKVDTARVGVSIALDEVRQDFHQQPRDPEVERALQLICAAVVLLEEASSMLVGHRV